VRRYVLIVLDGCGVGALADADRYGSVDPHSDTLAHVAEAAGGLSLPVLQRLGLGNLAPLPGVPPHPAPDAAWGRLAVRSEGKDSLTGHWEMMGIVTIPGFPIWPAGIPTSLLASVGAAAGVEFLGGRPASGTEILEQLGEEHLRTGNPIAYTSADSVFQIAAHETAFGLDRLYQLCAIARSMVPASRVIARPFSGRRKGEFRRSPERRDWPLAPTEPNLLSVLAAAGKRTHFIGRPAEFFPTLPFQTRDATNNNSEHADALAQWANGMGPGADAQFVFVNFEDFDMLAGHRNNPVLFAELLTQFDQFLGDELLPRLRDDDRLGITADHGNDPTTPSTDHSREAVPVLIHGSGLPADRNLGFGKHLCDWSSDIARWLGVEFDGPGTPFT